MTSRISSRRVAFGVTVLCVALVTLLPGSGPSTKGWCLLCGEHGTADAIRNIVLFLPLGVTAFLLSGGVALATAVASGISLVVEIAQIGIAGRDASFGDVVFNTLGGVIGAFATRRAVSWLNPSPSARRRLLTAATMTALLVISATGAVLHIELPVTTYYGQWTPRLGHFERYEGSVLNAHVGSLPVPVGRLSDGEVVRGLLLTGAPLSVTATAGPGPVRLAPIFSIYDEHQEEILLLGAVREALAFRIRTRAAPARLNVPTLRFEGALAGVGSGDPLEISTRDDGDGYCLRIAVEEVSSKVRERCGLGYTVASGWQLLAPAGLGFGMPALLDTLWLMSLYTPLGYWLRRDALGAMAILISAAGLLVIPSITPLVATPAIAFMAVGIGVLAGAGLHRWVSKRARAAMGDRA